ncbi:hypothetical protein [Microbulbifer sp. JMSA003]|uniref:hypothetical protein n=1 Tax=Microbulbifer sp. JMSA003 TaxID=3243369 RepID=UPI00403A3E41
MMILPPIEPFIFEIDKGFKRRIFNEVGKKIDVSGRTLLDVFNKRISPSKRTKNKVLEYLSDIGFWVPQSLMEGRSFARKNEWICHVEGLRHAGMPESFLPHLQGEILNLGKLDEELEFHYKNTDKILHKLSQSSISWFFEDGYPNFYGTKKRKYVRAKLATARMKTLLYLIACLEVELETSFGRALEYEHYLEIDESPRRQFFKHFQEKTELTSTNEMARSLAVKLGGDVESWQRTLRRISAGDHNLSQETLQNLQCLVSDDKGSFLFLDFYLAEIFRLIKLVVSAGEKHKIIELGFEKSMRETYQGFITYWKSSIGVVTPTNWKQAQARLT